MRGKKVLYYGTPTILPLQISITGITTPADTLKFKLIELRRSLRHPETGYTNFCFRGGYLGTLPPTCFLCRLMAKTLILMKFPLIPSRISPSPRGQSGQKIGILR